MLKSDAVIAQSTFIKIIDTSSRSPLLQRFKKNIGHKNESNFSKQNLLSHCNEFHNLIEKMSRLFSLHILFKYIHPDIFFIYLFFFSYLLCHCVVAIKQYSINRVIINSVRYEIQFGQTSDVYNKFSSAYSRGETLYGYNFEELMREWWTRGQGPLPYVHCLGITNAKNFEVEKSNGGFLCTSAT